MSIQLRVRVGFKVLAKVSLLTLLVSSLAAPSVAAGGDADSAIDELLSQFPSKETLTAASVTEQAALLAPCADLGFAFYCIGLGFRESTPDYGQLLKASDSGEYAPLGDKPFAAWVQENLALSDAEHQKAFVEEVSQAKAGLSKAQRVSELLAGPWKDAAGLPSGPVHARRSSLVIIADGYAAKQNQSNWCGPATFQMIEWAYSGSKESQSYWAGRLGTSSSGTSIGSMVSLTNSDTTWDTSAGTYIAQSISSWTSDQFWNAHVNQVSAPGPVIEHPELLTAYYSYLSHNGDGHFQVGRGYSQASGDPNRYVLILEPWNEADWWVGGNTTWGARSVLNSKLLNATKANAFQNIGL